MMKTAIFIPTYNAGQEIGKLLRAINDQNISLARTLIIDSGSTDNTVNIAKENGFEVVSIEKQMFSHGKTRDDAFRMLSSVDFIIFLTQDVEIEDKACFEKLLKSFNNAEVGAVYGRQLPKQNASFEARLLREFNYPSDSAIHAIEDKENLGIKTAFLSDSFTAYRVSALEKIGGFPRHVNMAEDMYVGAKLLKAGYKLAYNAEAKVYHSHNFTLAEHWDRYKKIGAFHKKEHWLLTEFGKSEGEGIKLLRKMLVTAMREGHIATIPSIIMGCFVKYIAYLKGKNTK